MVPFRLHLKIQASSGPKVHSLALFAKASIRADLRGLSNGLSRGSFRESLENITNQHNLQHALQQDQYLKIVKYDLSLKNSPYCEVEKNWKSKLQPNRTKQIEQICPGHNINI